MPISALEGTGPLTPTPMQWRRHWRSRSSANRALYALFCLLFLVSSYRFFTANDSRDDCLDELLTPVRDGSLYTFPDNGAGYEGTYITFDNNVTSQYHLSNFREQREPTFPDTVEGCLASGTECFRTSSPVVIDLVWTYANGSDPLHRYSHSVSLYAQHTASMAKIPMRALNSRAQAVLREYDELRFSLRSAFVHLLGKQGKAWLVLPDYDWPGCQGQGEWKLGQIPQWLNMRAHHQVRVVHHSQLWRGMAGLPTFNSLAIESQFANLPSTVSEHL